MYSWLQRWSKGAAIELSSPDSDVKSVVIFAIENLIISHTIILLIYSVNSRKEEEKEIRAKWLN